MQNVVIDNVDFVNMPAAKYWSFPKTYSAEKRRELAKQYVMSGNYVGATKKDGIWLLIIKDANGEFYVRTRTKTVNGDFPNKAPWIPHICHDLLNLPNETVLLGELYFPNNEGSRKVTSVFNCLKDKCLERQNKNGFLHFYCFDVLAYKGKSLLNTPIKKRIDHYLNYELLDVLKDNDYIEIAEYKEEEELWEMYGEILAAGGEGIVIQKKSSVYTPDKRPAHQSVKLKKEIANTIDVFIDGSFKPPTMEYSGKNLENWNFWANVKTNERFNKCMYNEYLRGETLVPVTKPFFMGWAAAISVSLMKDSKPTHIAWLSGIPDSIKEKIVTEPETLVNKVIEVNAMMVEKIDGEYSLRHAVVENWDRTDKRPEDCEWSQIEELA
jgi:hypothetical protein